MSRSPKTSEVIASENYHKGERDKLARTLAKIGFTSLALVGGWSLLQGIIGGVEKAAPHVNILSQAELNADLAKVQVVANTTIISGNGGSEINSVTTGNVSGGIVDAIRTVLPVPIPRIVLDTGAKVEANLNVVEDEGAISLSGMVDAHGNPITVISVYPSAIETQLADEKDTLQGEDSKFVKTLDAWGVTDTQRNQRQSSTLEWGQNNLLTACGPKLTTPGMLADATVNFVRDEMESAANAVGYSPTTQEVIHRAASGVMYLQFLNGQRTQMNASEVEAAIYEPPAVHDLTFNDWPISLDLRIGTDTCAESKATEAMITKTEKAGNDELVWTPLEGFSYGIPQSVLHAHNLAP